MNALTCESRVFGTGPIPALALHCGQGRGVMWRGVAAALQDRLTLVAPDLPGHGRSPDFPKGLDVHDVATEAVAQLHQRRQHLIGHSFGATLALRLALNAPDRVESLTLIEPVFFAALPDGLELRRHRAREREISAALPTDPALSARLFHEIWGDGTPWEHFSKGVQETLQKGMPFVVASEPALWADRAGMLAPGLLESVVAPTRLIRGEHTQSVIAGIHATLLGRLPNAQERVIAGAGHMVPLSHPRDVADIIAEML